MAWMRCSGSERRIWRMYVRLLVCRTRLINIWRSHEKPRKNEIKKEIVEAKYIVHL